MVRAWQAAYAGILPAAYLADLDADDEAANWADYLRDIPADQRLWVADEHDEVVGYCRCGPADGDPDLGRAAAEIYGIYIDPKWIGTGLGRELFTKAVTDLDARGFAPVCVYAYTSNDLARRFYERAGFMADGASRDSEEPELDVTEIRFVRTRAVGDDTKE
jgi:ribosomal protein S18 acetylase RimI-like enzyme